MIMTNSPSIQDVLFFPQMKPEDHPEFDLDMDFESIGIKEDYIPVLRYLGIQKVEDLTSFSSQKLRQSIHALIKKLNLSLEVPSEEEIKHWQQKISKENMEKTKS
jgi:lysyl-tRNA synthetase class 2